MTPNLTGRVACCHCGKTKPSDPDLFAFHFMGEGSDDAANICKCGYHKVAHQCDDDRVSPEPIGCLFGKFTARGPLDHDAFYCGCDGWD